ncbi:MULTISPECIES: toll/interleukin-1 receptor domain-containing protein [Aeromonas]|uniref:toll/interleukin-1 receptor domain-containing protein n=1 Tax=Aeromonas TaxID=642 RepID=UPI0013A542CA|nr:MULTISPECIES: toll/interleukin-1 receptor domain-containing protein [Aeromonas]
MKVFLSWSGTRSEKVAELLKEWLPCVLQASEPWVSTKDIDRGAQWFNSIQGQLQETTTGIICLTKDNKEKPWILFEAGALAKGLSDSRVCTLLIDLEPQHVRPPLGQFNHTQVNENDMFKLICTLNERLTKSLNMTTLRQVFNAQWPLFESEFNKIVQETQDDQVAPQAPIRAQDDILAEILELTRSLNSRVSTLEKSNGIDLNRVFFDYKSSKKDHVYSDSFYSCIQLFKNGMNINEISKELNMSRDSVISVLNKAKLATKLEFNDNKKDELI